MWYGMRKLFAMFILTIFVSGCTTSSITPNIPENTKFDQIELGMSQDEVEHILGLPTDVQTKPTTISKVWPPFYIIFLSDVAECTYFYKGQGSIVFGIKSISDTTGGVVTKINYDPTCL